MQPSSPEDPQPRKQRRVGASQFLDIEAAADDDVDDNEDINDDEEGFGMYQPPLTSGEK
jgi:hypothetical protein